MSKKTAIFLGLAALLFIAPGLSRADDKIDEEVSPRVKKIYLEPQRSLLDKGRVGFLLAVGAGYDNNAHLDSRREGDPYTQQFLRGAFNSSFSKDTSFEAAFEFMNLMYTGESKLDVVRAGISTEVEHAFSKNLIAVGGYNFDSIEYINTGTDDYVDHELDVKLKHKFADQMFHSLGYGFMYRDYAARYIRTTSGTSTVKNRYDVRHTMDYEIGRYFKKEMVKLAFQYFNNDSNDKFLNYYDYDSFRFGAAWTHIFSDKISSYLSASRQERLFRSRTLIADTGRKERDTTYLLSSALYYTFNRSTSCGLSYTYRQNKSNEPSERYSGSLVALSTYYRF